MKMYNFSDVEKFLKDEELWGIQCFCTRNTVGDEMATIYKKDGVTIDFCPSYWYIEVFGLTDEDFDKLRAVEEEE